VQFLENFLVNRQEEFCFIMAMPDPIQPKNSGENARTTSTVELLEHLPCSPDLAPHDFHLSGPLKNHIGGKCFADDEEAEMDV
jgi:hypothetical protein